MEETKKPWYKSLTLLSLIGAALGVFVPRYTQVIPQTITDAWTIINLINVGIGRIRTAKGVDLGGK